jgi:hypothetical protein
VLQDEDDAAQSAVSTIRSREPGTPKKWSDGRIAERAALAGTLGRSTVPVLDHNRAPHGAAVPHRDLVRRAHEGRLYLLSGGRERADWVRTPRRTHTSRSSSGDEAHVGPAHVLEAGAADDQLARQLLLTKYADTGDDLDEWGRTSLPWSSSARPTPTNRTQAPSKLSRRDGEARGLT